MDTVHDLLGHWVSVGWNLPVWAPAEQHCSTTGDCALPLPRLPVHHRYLVQVESLPPSETFSDDPVVVCCIRDGQGEKYKDLIDKFICSSIWPGAGRWWWSTGGWSPQPATVPSWVWNTELVDSLKIPWCPSRQQAGLERQHRGCVQERNEQTLLSEEA